MTSGVQNVITLKNNGAKKMKVYAPVTNVDTLQCG